MEQLSSGLGGTVKSGTPVHVLGDGKGGGPGNRNPSSAGLFSAESEDASCSSTASASWEGDLSFSDEGEWDSSPEPSLLQKGLILILV